MPDGTFIAELRTSLAFPQSLTVNGKQVLALPPGWTNGTPQPPQGAALKVGTLDGVINYMKSADMGGLATMIQIEGPTMVAVRGPIEGEETLFRRRTLLVADATLMGQTFPFGTFMDLEPFIIGLQSMFQENEGRRTLLAFMASVKEGLTRDSDDDGIAQSVVVKRGITGAANAQVPNPVALQPFRTFRDLYFQPESNFIARMKGGSENQKPQVALFEADGGAWKIDAINSIKQKLVTALEGVTIIG